MEKMKFSALGSFAAVAIFCLSSLSADGQITVEGLKSNPDLVGPKVVFVTGDSLHVNSNAIKVKHGVAGKLLFSAVIEPQIVYSKALISGKSGIGGSGEYPMSMVMKQNRGLLWSPSVSNPTGWFGGTPMSHTLVSSTETI